MSVKEKLVFCTSSGYCCIVQADPGFLIHLYTAASAVAVAAVDRTAFEVNLLIVNAIVLTYISMQNMSSITVLSRIALCTAVNGKYSITADIDYLAAAFVVIFPLPREIM